MQARKKRLQPLKARADQPHKLGSSRRNLELKEVLAACTIKLSPSVYRRPVTEEQFTARLEELLLKEGLGPNPTPSEIDECKARLQTVRLQPQR
jgi:hypothetical protein